MEDPNIYILFPVGGYPRKMHLVALEWSLYLSLLGTWTHTLQPKTLGERKPRSRMWEKWLIKVKSFLGYFVYQVSSWGLASPQKILGTFLVDIKATSSKCQFFLSTTLFSSSVPTQLDWWTMPFCAKKSLNF